MANVTEKLPVINEFFNVSFSEKKSSSLIGRGLNTILNKDIVLARCVLDKRYRLVRDTYNLITEDGLQSSFKIEWLPIQSVQSDMFEDNQFQPFYDKFKKLNDVYIALQQLADQGYGKAYFPLSIMYLGGQGISINIDMAKHYSRKAFEWCLANKKLNDPEIWTDLGWMYHHEYSEVSSDEEAEVFYSNAFELSHTDAPIKLMEWYEINWMHEDDEYRTFGLDMYWFRKAADYGFARAQHNVGFLFQSNPWAEQDFVVAALWYHEAAEQGHSDSQRSLGWMYRYAQGVDQDDEEAIFWFRAAAEQGHSAAQYDLGSMYLEGYCVEQDDEMAIFWFREAAIQGHSDAQCNLGWIYRYGWGLGQDEKQAVFWYRKAAEQGNEEAQEYLKNLSNNSNNT